MARATTTNCLVGRDRFKLMKFIEDHKEMVKKMSVDAICRMCDQHFEFEVTKGNIRGALKDLDIQLRHTGGASKLTDRIVTLEQRIESIERQLQAIE